MNQRTKWRSKPIKFLEENPGKSFMTLDLVMISRIWYQRHRQQKKKDKLDIKLKLGCQRIPWTEWKGEPQEKIFLNHKYDKESILRKYIGQNVC